MIKETVDAVRVAEMDAEKIVATASDNAFNMKQDIKVQAEQYRTDLLQKAKQQAKKDMETLVRKCNEYDKEYNEKINKKVAELKEIAAKKEEIAVNTVIDSLV